MLDHFAALPGSDENMKTNLSRRYFAQPQPIIVNYLDMYL